MLPPATAVVGDASPCDPRTNVPAAVADTRVAPHPPTSTPPSLPRQVMVMNPWSLIVLAVLALLWGYAYVVRTTPLVLGGRELRCGGAGLVAVVQVLL